MIPTAQAELFFHRDLNRQTMRVPTTLARDFETLHAFVTREQILKRSSQHVVHGGLTVRGGRPLVEDETGTIFGLRAFEHILFLPELEHLRFDFLIGRLRWDFIEHRTGF
jgi:hypothetical protein